MLIPALIDQLSFACNDQLTQLLTRKRASPQSTRSHTGQLGVARYSQTLQQLILGFVLLKTRITCPSELMVFQKLVGGCWQHQR